MNVRPFVPVTVFSKRQMLSILFFVILKWDVSLKLSFVPDVGVTGLVLWYASMHYLCQLPVEFNCILESFQGEEDLIIAFNTAQSHDNMKTTHGLCKFQ